MVDKKYIYVSRYVYVEIFARSSRKGLVKGNCFPRSFLNRIRKIHSHLRVITDPLLVASKTIRNPSPGSKDRNENDRGAMERKHFPRPVCWAVVNVPPD